MPRWVRKLTHELVEWRPELWSHAQGADKAEDLHGGSQRVIDNPLVTQVRLNGLHYDAVSSVDVGVPVDERVTGCGGTKKRSFPVRNRLAYLVEQASGVPNVGI
jgi:hypothetical protein